LKRGGVEVFRVSPEQFRSVSTAARAAGIGALVRRRWTPLEQIDPRRGLCLLAIEAIRSPGNLGTILRTAEACGVGAVLFVDSPCDPYDPVVARAGMGGTFHLPLVRTTREELSRWSRRREVRFIGLAPQASQLWTALPDDGAICLVVGEERGGLSPAMRSLCDFNVRLPMTGKADSLNVGVAVGVAMYELVRRAHP
jgi:TrmH family RNA methyltransferase